MYDDTSVNERDESGVSENEKNGAECDAISESNEQEPSEHEPSEIESETADAVDSRAQDEEEAKRLGPGVEKGKQDGSDRIKSDINHDEKETSCEDEGEQEDDLGDKKMEDGRKEGSKDHDKDKPLYPWMFSMSELCKGLKMLLPVDGVYYPGRIDAIHVPDL